MAPAAMAWAIGCSEAFSKAPARRSSSVRSMPGSVIASTKVILPNMRAAIMVAVLFRALDAFRIFDNIYVLTGGANSTGSVSSSAPP